MSKSRSYCPVCRKRRYDEKLVYVDTLYFDGLTLHSNKVFVCPGCTITIHQNLKNCQLQVNKILSSLEGQFKS